MALDKTRIGNVTSEQLEALDADYPEDTNAEVYSAISIVEIVKEDGDQRARAVRVRLDTEGDLLRIVAVLRAAEMQLLAQLGYSGGPPSN
ncbi:MAG TPA: hypothetical protein VGD00_11195 [Solirubrobacteraceae bacterium]|jgi:hypothetical protein